MIQGNMQMGFNGIVNLIARRDNMDIMEARELVTECQQAMIEAMQNGDDPEEILAQELGLEPDYLFDLLTF